MAYAGSAVSAEPVSAPAGQASVERSARRFGFSVDRDLPMTITADRLEVERDVNGSDRLVFEERVKVEQGDLTVECDWLESVYSGEMGGRAEQITARGNVRVAQGETEVFCGQVVFRESACSALCTPQGRPVVLRRGENVVEGEQILFNLCTGAIKVRRGQVHLPGSGDVATHTTPAVTGAGP